MHWLARLAILACGGALLGCGAAVPAPAASPDAAPGGAPALVARGTVQPRLLLTGELAAVRAENVVVPRTTSWQMPVRWIERDGARVRVGQKVLELDNSQFAGDLEQNRLAAAKALNDLLQKQADLEVELADRGAAVERARIELEKARLRAELPADLLTRRDYQDRQLDRAKAEIAVQKALEDLEASRRAAGAEKAELRIAKDKADEAVAQAERAIAALTLLAPGDGIFVVAQNPNERRKLQPGDNVWVGLPVATIPDLSEMKVEAQLSDVDDGKIAPGMATRSTLDAFPELSVPGRVLDIAPIAQPPDNESVRRTFRVAVSLERTDVERMRPGMSVLVEVERPPIEALVAPRAALDLSGEAPRARLADGSSVEVRLGPCDALRCVVEEGLVEGQALRVGT